MPVHFQFDEAASLGHLEIIEDAVDKFRAYDIRLYFYYQSLGQLKKCFPNGQDQTLLSNTTQILFAVNDNATAEFVSNRLGEETIVVDSGGSSDGGSYQNTRGNQPQQSCGSSWNTNRNWNQQARKLLKPEEVMALPPDIAITFAPGVPPVLTRLIKYFDKPVRPGRSDWMPVWMFEGARFALSLIMLLSSIVFAIALSDLFLQRISR